MGNLGAIAHVLPRYQLTLPKDVRGELGVEPGDDLLFYKGDDGDWHIRRKARSILDLFEQVRSELAGNVTVDDVLRWRREEDDRR